MKHWKKSIHRILAMVMVVTMLGSSFCISALAEEPDTVIGEPAAVTDTSSTDVQPALEENVREKADSVLDPSVGLLSEDGTIGNEEKSVDEKVKSADSGDSGEKSLDESAAGKSLKADVNFKTYSHNNGEDVANVPETVTLTLLYSADGGSSWTAFGFPVTVEIDPASYTGSYTWQDVPAAIGDSSYSYKVEETLSSAKDYWLAAVSAPTEGADGNFSVTIKNCPPLSVVYDIAWSSAEGTSGKFHYEDLEIDGSTENKLILHNPTNASTSLNIQVHMNVLGDSERSYAAGTVQFKVPKTIFEDRSGNAYGTLSWQIPKAPATNDQSVFNYVDDGNGNYIVTNWAAIEGGTDLKYTVTYTYSPSYLPGGYLVSGTFGKETAVYGGDYLDKKVDIPLTITGEAGDGSDNIQKNDSLYYEFHSRVTQAVLSKEEAEDNRHGIFFKWQDVWGTNPDPEGEAAEKYFYIVWYARIQRVANGNASQSFSMRLEELGGTEGGELVGAKGIPATGTSLFKPDANNLYGGRYPEIDTTYAGIAGENWESQLTFRGYTNGVDGSYYLECYPAATRGIVLLLMRYPMSLYDNMSAEDAVETGVPVTNTLKLTTVGDDSEVVDGVEYGTVSVTSTANINVRKNRGGGGGLTVAKSRYSYYRVAGGQTAVTSDIVTPVRPDFSYSIAANGIPYDINTETGKTDLPYTISIQDNEIYLSTLSTTSETQWPRVYSGNNGLSADRYNAMLLQQGDYEFTQFYISISEYDAVYEGGGWVANNTPSADYSQMLKTDVYCNGVKYGEITRDSSGKYILTTASGTQTVTESSPAVLPAGTYDVRFDHQSQFYNCQISATLGINLLPSDRVKERVQKDIDSNKYTGITNIGKSTLVQTDTNGQVTKTQAADTKDGDYLHTATYYMNQLSYSHYLNKNTSANTFQNNTTTGEQKWTAWILVGLDATCDASYKNQLLDAKNARFKNFTLYDLLPVGTRTNANEIIAGISGTGQGGIYGGAENRLTMGTDFDAEVDDNWNGTGRTMLIIHFHTEKLLTYLQINYPLYNTLTNIEDYGANVVNQIALADDSGTTSWKFGSRYSSSAVNEPEMFASANPEAYAQKTFPYQESTVLQVGFSKLAKSENVNKFASETEAYFEDEYQYRLYFASEGDETQAGSIVYFDTMEDGGLWQGTLKEVNTAPLELVISATTGVKCAPVVYYSTKLPSKAEMESAAAAWSKGESADSSWSSTMPEKSKIKAIAIDCSHDANGDPFVLGPGKKLSAYVVMTAPADESLVNKTTTNDAHIFYRTFTQGTDQDFSKALDSNFSQASVTLRDAAVTLHKTSIPATGAETAPAEISNLANQKITYTLTSKNESTSLTYNNVVIEDPIPDGLTIDTANIKVTITNSAGSKVANNVLVSTRGDISTEVDGQTLTLTYLEFQPGYTITFTIPTIQENPVVKTTDYINQAVISKIGNHEEDIESETTYHRVIQQYSLTYHVIDAGSGVPEEFVTPEKVTGIEYDTEKTLEASSTTSTTKPKDTVDIPGEWVFMGWYHTEQDAKDAYSAMKAGETVPAALETITIRTDEDVYGGYVFLPETHKLTYVVAEDETWGLPEDSVVPNPVEGIEYYDGVTLTAPLSSADSNALRSSDNEQVPGTWTFTGWNETSALEGDPITGIEHVIKDETVYGGWKFTPTTYKVTYEVAEDPVYGAPTDAAAPEDDNSPYNWKDLVSIKDDLVSAEKEAQLSDGSFIPGRWIFSGWDKEAFNITEDTVIYGSWKFMPTFDLIVEKVWKDNNNEDKVRPSSVTITVLANGTPMEDRTQRITASNNWTVTISGLDVYDDDGNEIVYTVVESAVDSYSASYQVSADNTKITITNSHAKTAYTGDENPTVLFAALSAMSLFGIAGLSFTAGSFRKKENLD